MSLNLKMAVCETLNAFCLYVRQVKCLVSMWMHHVPHHAVAILLSTKENVAPHVMVSIFYLQFPRVFVKFVLSNSSKHNQSLYLFLQNVSMIIGCMLMEKCSVLLGVDPACSAGVRQVSVGYSKKKVLRPLSNTSSVF